MSPVIRACRASGEPGYASRCAVRECIRGPIPPGQCWVTAEITTGGPRRHSSMSAVKSGDVIARLCEIRAWLFFSCHRQSAPAGLPRPDYLLAVAAGGPCRSSLGGSAGDRCPRGVFRSLPCTEQPSFRPFERPGPGPSCMPCGSVTGQLGAVRRCLPRSWARDGNSSCSPSAAGRILHGYSRHPHLCDGMPTLASQVGLASP